MDQEGTDGIYLNWVLGYFSFVAEVLFGKDGYLQTWKLHVGKDPQGCSMFQ